MRKLSQKEMIEEGALRALAALGGRELAKKVSPSLYKDVTGAAKAIKSAWSYQSPTSMIEKHINERPDIYHDVRNIKETKDASTDKQDQASVTWTFTNNKEEEVTMLTKFTRPSGSDIWTIASDEVINNVPPKDVTEHEAVMADFKARQDAAIDRAQQRVSDMLDAAKEPSPLPDTEEPQPKETSQPSKPLIPRRRSGSSKNKIRGGENEESEKSQKSLLKHLQSWSR